MAPPPAAAGGGNGPGQASILQAPELALWFQGGCLLQRPSSVQPEALPPSLACSLLSIRLSFLNASNPSLPVCTLSKAILAKALAITRWLLEAIPWASHRMRAGGRWERFVDAQ